MKKPAFVVLLVLGTLGGCASYGGSKSVAWTGGKLAIAGAAIVASGCLLGMQEGADRDIALGTVVGGGIVGMAGAIVSGVGLTGMAFHAIDGLTTELGPDEHYTMPELPASTVSTTIDEQR